MTDYIPIVLQGFSTGMGVIFANEVWNWFKHHRVRKIIDDEIKRLRGMIQ
jgi:hypothetical protein